MKKISFRTSQNVVIDFKIATLGSRIISFFIDMAIIMISTIMLAIILIPANENFIYVLPLPFIFYTLVCELSMNGQSLGKKIMRIRVVNVIGKEPKSLDFIIRWVFRLVDIFLSLGSLAVIFVSTTPRGQRLGGVLSNTMVISLRGEMSLSLVDILGIEDRQSYAPQYLEAYRFNETEMLTIKMLLDRSQKYHNEAHKKLMDAAAERVANVLEIPAPDDKPLFLQTVLRDYIVLTRS